MNRNFFYFALFIIMLLVLGLMFLGDSDPAGEETAAVWPADSSASAPAGPALPPEGEQTPSYDFTSLIDTPDVSVPPAKQVLARTNRSAAVSYAAAPQAIRYDPAARPGNGLSASAGRKTVFPQARPGGAAAPAPATGPGRTYSPRYTPGMAGEAQGGYRPAAQDPGAEEAAQARQTIWNTSAPALTYRQQKEMNRKIDAFSSGIQRAIVQAMAPRSKRSQNIAKYLGRSQGEAAQMEEDVQSTQEGQVSGNGQNLAAQIAAQAQGVVSDVRSNYGDKAAARAGKIMDNFQREMTQAMQASGDPQEKQIRASAINTKYANQLQQLNQNESLNKMEMQLRADNEKQLAALERQFGPAAAGAAREKMENDLQQRMKVYRTPQAEEEMTRQLLALDEQRRKDLEEAVRKNVQDNPFAAGQLTEVQNAQAKQQILQEAQAIKEGRQQARYTVYSQNKLDQTRQTWQKEGEKIVQGFEQLGPEYAAEAKELVDNLNKKRTEMRPVGENINTSELNSADMKLTEETNQKLQALRVRGVAEAYNKSNDERLKQITDQMGGVDEQTKQAWSKKARSVMEKYNRQRAQAFGQKDYEATLKRLEQQEQKELAALRV